MHMRICFFWNVKMTSSAGNGPQPFWICTLASSWRVNLTQKKSSLEHEVNVFPKELHEQECGVTPQKTVILNYTLW